MSDKAESHDLEAVLARLEKDWQQLAQLIRTPASSSSPMLEAEKFLLKDATGRPRAELRLTSEGGAALILSDAEGRSRAQLGLNDQGGAYLTLRDQYGGIIFQAPDGPRAPQTPGEAGEVRPALDPSLSARLEQLGGDLDALRELLHGPVPEAPPEPLQAPAAEAEPGLKDRLARVERQVRAWKRTGAAALTLGLLALAGLGLTLSRGQWQGGPVAAPAFILQGPAGTTLARLGAPEGQPRLDLLDQAGKVRATLGLEAGGTPGLKLCDPQEKPRAELALGPEGEVALNLRDENGQLRTALGNVGPQNLGPAATMVRDTSSLALFDEKGRLIWLAPRRWRP